MLTTQERPQDHTQIGIALEQQRKVARFRGGLYIWWGVVTAKCILAEWMVRRYAMPFNSLYMWVPTIGFTLLATWIYAGVTLRDVRRMPLTGRFASRIWLGFGIAASVMGIVGVAAGTISGYLLPGIFSAFLGAAYFVHSALDNRHIFKAAAIGWWMGAIYLIAKPNLDALGWFSLMIILLQVLPTTALYLPAMRAKKPA